MIGAYSPKLGRFLNRDPIKEKGGTNLFEYAYNNPINFSDPSGLMGFPSHTCPVHQETPEECRQRCEDNRDANYALCDKINDPVERQHCYDVANDIYDKCIANCGKPTPPPPGPGGPPPAGGSAPAGGSGKPDNQGKPPNPATPVSP